MVEGKRTRISLFGHFCINYDTFASTETSGAKPFKGMVLCPLDTESNVVLVLEPPLSGHKRASL